MKKFFGKLPVMITFIALAVIMAVAYIGLLVRPVAIGMTYKGDMDIGMGKMDTVVKVTSSSKVDVKAVMENTTMEFEDVRYIEHDRQILVLLNPNTRQPMEMTDKEYEEYKKEKIKNWDKMPESTPFLFDINAFEMGEDDNALKCTGSVVFAIVGGIVELVLLAGAGLAIFYKVKK